MIDFKAAAAAILPRARDLVPQWLGGGRVRGHEYVCADIHGGHGDSFSVNLDTGMWADFAHPEIKGGDLISLYAEIHQLAQFEAVQQLRLDTEKPKTNGATRVHIDAPMQTPPFVKFDNSMFRHPRFGTPTAFWVYRDAQNLPMFVVARYDPGGERKQIVPWIYVGKWVMRAPGKPRPLYNLNKLAEFTSRVIIVEGEKCAEAAQRTYWRKRPCITWMGGVAGIKHADWEPLRGRRVTLWPDNDEPGRQAMATLSEILITLDCEIRIIDSKDFGPGDPGDGYDIADAELGGMSGDQVSQYATAHSHVIERPGPQLPRVAEAPDPGTQVYEQKPAPGSWLARWQNWGLDTKPSGRPYANQLNVQRIIEIARMGIYWDTFSQRIMCDANEWSDAMTANFTTILQERYGISELRPYITFEGITSYAFGHHRNPVQEWLNGLKYSGRPVLQDLLTVGFGARPGAYTDAVGRCFLVGMVARVMRPGCKVDQMPIFEGDQGVGKSTALGILGGPYFAEIHESITSKDFYLSITGKMLCEISELSAFTTTEINRIKGVISNPSDRYRAPYGTMSADHPRSCVFAGTTNRDDWNTDETGARRFWPVRCGEINRGWLEDNREQLFAEAMSRYNSGEQWWDVPETEANTQRAARMEVDPWQYKIQGYCDANQKVSIGYIIENVLSLEPSQTPPGTARRIGKILRQLGFEHKAVREGSKVQKQWRKRLV
jgi:putative DNA primase/helicase